MSTDPTYFAGPLDGQPARKVRGRWSTFRDLEGRPVPTAVGDALIGDGERPLTAKATYLLVEDERGATYVWVPSWHAWRRRPQPEGVHA